MDRVLSSAEIMPSDRTADPDPAIVQWRRFLRCPAVNFGTYAHCAHVLRLAQPRPGDAVLDVGCGGGLFEQLLAGRVARVVGIDVSPEVVRSLREAGLPHGAEVELVDATRPTPPEIAGRFDRVLCMDVLEHVDEPSSVMRFVAGALRDTGVGVVSFPMEDREHGRLIRRNDVLRMTRELGLPCRVRFTVGRDPSVARALGWLRARMPLPEVDRYDETLAHRLDARTRRSLAARALYAGARLALVALAKACGDYLDEARDGEPSHRCILVVRRGAG
jgi:SAM-dependent methyltransferase